MAILAVGGILTGVEIDKIRIGGPLADAQQQVSDLQADILPPPAYIVEPYLEATLLVRHPETLSTRRAKLAALEASFRSSIARWRASSVDKELKSLLVDRAARQADRFWTELDGVTLPALRRGDQAAVDASYARLTDAYVAHRRDIDTLVRSVSAAQARVNEASLSSLHMTIAILALLGLAIAAMLIGGLVYLMRRVLGPVGATADAMHRMADGDLALKLDGGERADEIGTMVSAVEVFRVAAQAQRVNVDKQETVVRELAGALDQLGRAMSPTGSAMPCPPNIAGWPCPSTPPWSAWATPCRAWRNRRAMSAPARRRFVRHPTTCRNEPSSRPPAWRRRRRRWTRSPAASARRRAVRSASIRSSRRRTAKRRNRATSSAVRSTRWARSSGPRPRSPTSSGSSTASRSRPTCWP
ncbi:HAMP domain-containing protein [Sphingomonas sp. I4]